MTMSSEEELFCQEAFRSYRMLMIGRMGGAGYPQRYRRLDGDPQRYRRLYLKCNEGSGRLQELRTELVTADELRRKYDELLRKYSDLERLSDEWKMRMEALELREELRNGDDA